MIRIETFSRSLLARIFVMLNINTSELYEFNLNGLTKTCKKENPSN